MTDLKRPEECVQSLLFQFHYNILGEGENRLLGFQGLGSIISNTQNIQCSKPHSGVFNKLLGVWEHNGKVVEHSLKRSIYLLNPNYN